MWHVFLKDLRVELRTREMSSSLLMVGVLMLLVLNFAFDPSSGTREAAAPGVLWVSLIFAGVLSVNRLLLNEREGACMDALLLAPIERSSLFVAKTAATFVLMLAGGAVLVPAFIVLFNLPFLETLLRLLPVMLLGLAGFAAIGTLFAAVSIQTRAREVLLPLLILPLATPLFLAAVELTRALLSGAGLRQSWHWVRLLAAFDVVFFVIGWLGFEFVVEE